MNIASKLVTTRRDRSQSTSERMARGLGWFSIGLGVAEIVAPGKLAKLLGLEGRETLLRAYGGREIGAGVWALSNAPMPAIWSRFAGDLVDLGSLGLGVRDGDDEQRRNAWIAIAAVGGITLVDLLVAASLTAEAHQRKDSTASADRDSQAQSGASEAADREEAPREPQFA